jgi:hypothetical protein
MKISRAIFLNVALFAGCSALIVGCDRGENQPPPGPDAPATRPAIDIPATTPANPGAMVAAAKDAATSQPALSVLVIENHAQIFASAMLRLSKADGHVVARLYSDDPRSALSENVAPDSYDFEMSLTDITDPADISKSVWTYASPDSDRQESPYGIFLDNQQTVLQPMNVTAKFLSDGQAGGDGQHVEVVLQGTFRLFRTDEVPAPPPMIVHVVGSVLATVPGK